MVSDKRARSVSDLVELGCTGPKVGRLCPSSQAKRRRRATSGCCVGQDCSVEPKSTARATTDSHDTPPSPKRLVFADEAVPLAATEDGRVFLVGGHKFEDNASVVFLAPEGWKSKMLVNGGIYFLSKGGESESMSSWRLRTTEQAQEDSFINLTGVEFALGCRFVDTSSVEENAARTLARAIADKEKELGAAMTPRLHARSNVHGVDGIKRDLMVMRGKLSSLQVHRHSDSRRCCSLQETRETYSLRQTREHRCHSENDLELVECQAAFKKVFAWWRTTFVKIIRGATDCTQDEEEAMELLRQVDARAYAKYGRVPGK